MIPKEFGKPIDIDIAATRLFALYLLHGTNDKKAHLLKIYRLADAGDTSAQLTIYLLKILLDPGITTGLNKIQMPGLHEAETILDPQRLVAYIETITSPHSNMNTSLRNMLSEMLGYCEFKTAKILQELLQGTFKIGLTIKSVNSIIPGFAYEMKCMLADAPDDASTTKYPVRVDIKYDGVRILAIVRNGKVTLRTRQGKLVKFKELEAEIIKLVGKDNSCVLDGEIESTTGLRTGISGVITSNIASGYQPSHDVGIRYIVFDMLTTDEFDNQVCTRPLKHRQTSLSHLFAGCNSVLTKIQECGFTICSTEEAVIKTTNDLIQAGYEGSIVKNLDGAYEFKRSANWIKHKAINSCTLECIGTTDGKNKRSGKIGALHCATSCGKLNVFVGSGMDDADIDLFTKVSPVGKFIEVLYNCIIEDEFGNYSLFLPRMSPLKVRSDKDEADSLEKMFKEHIGKPQIKSK